jgi:tetratricopeptide (TPR) repeat protein
MSTVTSEFYVIGGTLRRDAPSYVKREADDNLYNRLKSGQFCYVLTSRQMGKSSLMVRTAVRLRADDVSVAVLDLTAIGQNVTAEQWYEGLLGLIGQQLNLEDELESFWLDNKRIGPFQRWMRAIREVVMARRRGRIVIFVDEIDAVRSLSFSTDEFFAGIREFYNWRTEDEELTRLTFCLLGVATPSDLIHDTKTTPFNIGQRIELTDFAEAEAAPLVHGLGRDEKLGRLLLQRVLYWTGGHPYLTQRLCQSVAADDSVRSPKGVDRLCEEIFLSSRARERDHNLLFVSGGMLRSEESDLASLLDLYQQVWKRKRVPDDEANSLISVLRLSGITRAVDGFLYVRNQIYYHVFDREWVTANMPDAELRRQRAAYRKGLLRAAAVAAMILTLMSGLVFAALQQRNVAREQRRRADENAEQLRVALDITKEQQLIAEERSREADRQKQIAEDKSREAAANATRAEIALKAAREQKKIAEQNVQLAKAALKTAERNEQTAKESERRLRRQNIDNNNLIHILTGRLEQLSPVKEKATWSNVKGSALMQMRNYEAAINEFSKSIIADPDNLSGLTSRSYLYTVIGQPENTIKDAEAALKINPSYTPASLNLSLSLSLLGRYDKAAANVETSILNFRYMGDINYLQPYVSPEIRETTGRRVVKADGKTALTALYYELANIRAFAGGEGFEAALIAADRRPENVNAYLYALNWAWMNYEKRPQDFGALAAQGALWERAGFIDRAMIAYKKFQTEHKGRSDNRRYDNLARWVSRRVDALQSSVSRNPATQSQPEQLNAQDLYLEGLDSLYSGKTGTLNFMTQAIQSDPDNVDYLIGRAKFHYDRKDFVGTRIDCNTILSLAPTTAIAYLYRALANISEGLNTPKEVIIKDIKKAKELDPTMVPYGDDQSSIKISEMLAQSDIDEAFDFLERIVKYAFPSPQPYLQMAKLLNEKGSYQKALEKINIAIALRSNETRLYDERRRAEEGLCPKKDAKGSACLNQVEIVRRQASAYKEVGDALLKQGRMGEALDIYTKSLSFMNDLADPMTLPQLECDVSATLFKIAHTIEEQGTKAKAIEYLETEVGTMKNLKDSLNKEIKRLSDSP